METIVVTEKWDKDRPGAAGTVGWSRSTGTSTTTRPNRDPTQLFTAANRHTGLVNCPSLTDAKALHRVHRASKDLTGCSLVHSYPVPRASRPADPVTSRPAPGGRPEPNICAGLHLPLRSIVKGIAMGSLVLKSLSACLAAPPGPGVHWQSPHRDAPSSGHDGGL